MRGHAAALGESLPEHIERQLRMLSAVVAEVKAADQQLRKLAGDHAVCRRLMTVPGVGPLTALRFVATIDEPERVATAHHVQSYLGLTPGEHSSSERERRTGDHRQARRARAAGRRRQAIRLARRTGGRP